METEIKAEKHGRTGRRFRKSVLLILVPMLIASGGDPFGTWSPTFIAPPIHASLMLVPLLALILTFACFMILMWWYRAIDKDCLARMFLFRRWFAAIVMLPILFAILIS